MEDQRAKVRINIKTGEFEVEGPQAFVREYEETFQELIEQMATWSEESPGGTGASTEAEIEPDTTSESLPDTFGEYYNKFPKSLTDTDKVLVAAHFVQANDPDKSFTTRAANKLLKEQGVKVGNAAMAVTSHRDQKRVFVHKKGSFRVSEAGHEYIESKRAK